MKKNNYIILGNSGFIGRNLQKYLKRKKKSVIGFSSKKINLLVKTDALKLSRFIDSNSIIIFLSFNKNQKNATTSELKKNLLMTENFLNVLEKKKPKMVIFFSSQTVYGENTHNLNITEKTLPNPTSFYGIAKYTSERMINKYCLEKEITFMIIRIPRIYGSDDDINNYGPTKFIYYYKKNKKLDLWGDGKEKRDYLHINDLNKIVLKLIMKNFNGLINICSGVNYSFLQIINYIEVLTGNKFSFKKKKRSRPKVDHGMKNKFLKKVIGNYKFVPLRDGLKSLLN